MLAVSVAAQGKPAAPPRAAPAGKMHVTIAGSASRQVSVDAVCRQDPLQPEVFEVQGKSADLLVRFALHNRRKGTHRIIMDGLSEPDGPFARFNVLMIGDKAYTAPSGEVTLADDRGRAGVILAKRFTTVGSRTAGAANLTLDAAWTCK